MTIISACRNIATKRRNKCVLSNFHNENTKQTGAEDSKETYSFLVKINIIVETQEVTSRSSTIIRILKLSNISLR